MEEDYEVSDVNYWTDVKDITNVISSTKGTMLLIHNYVSFEDLTEFLNRLPLADQSTIVYISLNKTYDFLKPFLKKVKSKIYIVEGVSAGLFAHRESLDDATFIRPPLTLNNLFEVIETYYKERSPDYIFVDALSQLLNFSGDASDSGSFFLFSNRLNESIGESTKLVFMYGEDPNQPLKNLPKMQVGRMIRMEVYRSKVNWRD
jgi:hypothetical protein